MDFWRGTDKSFNTEQTNYRCSDLNDLLELITINYARYNRMISEQDKCMHENLYPDMKLQLKMASCMHYLIHGFWECQDCGEWIFLEMEDEWEGREGKTTKDGKYQFQIVDFKNKMVRMK